MAFESDYGGFSFNAGSLVTGVSSVFGRTGAVIAQSGDYTTAQVTESGNLYFTGARAIASVLTGYTSGAGTVSASDTILSAIQKINGNTTSLYLTILNPAYTGSLTTGTLGYSDTGIFASFQASVNSYEQIILRNSNGGATASSDLIINNDQSTASTFYGDFGMNSSGFTGTGSINLANAVYLTSTSGELVLGTTTANGIRFVVNNASTDALSINSSGKATFTASSTEMASLSLLDTTYKTVLNISAANTLRIGNDITAINCPTTVTAVALAPDTDAAFAFGRTKIASPISDRAMFAHFDQMTSTGYALLQNTSGGTQLNAASGQTIVLKINNSTVSTVSGTEMKIASGQNFWLGNAATTGLSAGVLAASTNASIVLYDSGGQAYRIPCII